MPWQLAVGLAAVTIGVLAQLFVSRASLSRVALSVPAVVIMIPGVPFYRAISALNNRAVDANVAVGQAAGRPRFRGPGQPGWAETHVEPDGFSRQSPVASWYGCSRGS